MWRMLLAFLGYDLTNDDDKKPPPPKVKDAIKHSGKAITQGARAMTRRAATVGSRTAPLPQRPGGPAVTTTVAATVATVDFPGALTNPLTRLPHPRLRGPPTGLQRMMARRTRPPCISSPTWGSS